MGCPFKNAPSYEKLLGKGNPHIMGILDKLAAALGPGPRNYKILVIGLDNSGKSTMINFLKPTEEKVSGEMQPTVGNQAEKVKFKNALLQFNDMSGQGKYRAMWEHCFADCNAIIFVVDGTDKMRMTVMKEEFDGVMQNPTIQERKSLPVAVLVNKSDQPDFMLASRVQDLLEVDKVLPPRPYIVRSISATLGDNVTESFDWLIQNLNDISTKPASHD